MTALAATHGSVADFELGTSGSPGTGVVVSQYMDDVTFAMARDKAETSAFKQLFKSYVAGLIDLTIAFNGIADQNIDGQLYNLLIMAGAGNAIQYIYYPEGISPGSGTAFWTGLGFVDKLELKSAINSAYVFSANFQASGTPSRATQ